MNLKLLRGLGLSLVAVLMASAAQAATLSNGTGDGTVSVTVDGTGRFGSGGGAIYDPVGGIGAASTTFDSFIALPNVVGRSPLDQFGVQVTEVSQTATDYVTSFSINFLSFTLTQSLVDSFDQGVLVGAALIQQFAITNTANVTNTFDLVRYLDGDLLFDGTLADSGGSISVGGSQVLFETDGAGGSNASTTFLGVTTSVFGMTNSVADTNFEIDRFSGLQSRILSGENLDNTIAGDGDGDGFIDGAYDVTLAFQDYFSLDAGQTVTYTTTTLFGNAVPPSPGSTEALPLLPNDIGPNGGFVFELDADLFDNGDIVWIDPIIAVGYTYTVTGAEFASVTAPSLGLVNDPDGYIVTVGGNTFSLMSGATFNFADGVTEFTITDIATGLALDPTNLTAFATGIALRDFVSNTVIVTQTPITLDVPDVAPIPLPAGGLLLGGTLIGLMVLRRRRVL